MTDKIPITVEVPKADVWVRSDYRDIVRRLGEVHMIRACEHQHDDDWIPLYSIDVIAALQAEIERLQAELGAAEAFHRVAVAERNHERVITARLRADLDRFAADNQAAVRAYAAEINEAKAEIERLRADAGRYQWIRDRDVIDWDSLVYCCLPTGYEHPDNAINSSAMLLDAAIDAAMKEERK